MTKQNQELGKQRKYEGCGSQGKPRLGRNNIVILIKKQVYNTGPTIPLADEKFYQIKSI